MNHESCQSFLPSNICAIQYLIILIIYVDAYFTVTYIITFQM